MNNPASVFGHTLLRIDVAGDAESDEILGWAVDFTAETGDDDGVVYMAKGVTGRYPAAFGVRPYYQQLKRYSDWENRDIWEYRLNLDESQRELLLMHLWELQSVEFPYYFFTRNCSYELLRLLDASVAELDASAGFRGPVIPVDTVRALTERPGFVTNIRYRPSPATKLRAALRGLETGDESRVREIVEGRLDPADEALEEAPARAPRSHPRSRLRTAPLFVPGGRRERSGVPRPLAPDPRRPESPGRRSARRRFRWAGRSADDPPRRGTRLLARRGERRLARW